MNFLVGVLSPTRTVGLICCLVNLAACVVAFGIGRGNPGRGRLAATLAALQSALLVDLIFNGRWLLHDRLMNDAIALKIYERRNEFQPAALALVAALVAAGAMWGLRRLRGRVGAVLAVCGMLAWLGCWCVEVISLHSIDALLYRSLDGIKAVSVVWICCSLMIGTGILWDAVAGESASRLNEPAEEMR
jgi:hypothetical protein